MKTRTYIVAVFAVAMTLSWKAKAVTPITAGTPVIDQQVANNVQSLNQTLHKDASDEISTLKQQLQELGNPQQYIGLLQNQLTDFNNVASALDQKGQAVSDKAAQSMRTATGDSAVAYSGYNNSGLYTNLKTATNAQGQPLVSDVTNLANFKKFGVMQAMYDNYQTELKTYDTQMQSLQTQLVTAMDNLNKASTEMETLKYQGQVSGLNALISALFSKMSALGQEVMLQQMSNENDAARVQELANQQKVKEQQMSMTNFIQYLKQKTGNGTPTPMK